MLARKRNTQRAVDERASYGGATGLSGTLPVHYSENDLARAPETTTIYHVTKTARRQSSINP